MIIVPSIAPSTPSEAFRMIDRLPAGTEMMELRTDLLDPVSIGKIVERCHTGVILSHRSVREGGHFGGTADEYLDVIRRASQTTADLIDVEFGKGMRVVREAMRIAGRKRTILSHHRTSGSPAGVPGLFRRMASVRPAIVKISFSARSVKETSLVYQILREGRALRQRTVAIAMGEFGTHTRILQGTEGGYLSFSAPFPGRKTAPGQLTHRDMTGLYGADHLDRATKIFGLVGYPVTQSRGKYFHNALFRRKKLNAVYVDVPVDNLRLFMSTIAVLFTGLSVTMPYKQEMIRFLDGLEESVRLTGAVNTVLKKRGRLIGYNTDYEAFHSIIGRRMNLRGKSVVILGTGAVASTVIRSACERGARVTLCGRSLQRTAKIARRFGIGAIPRGELTGMRGDLLINTTPVGMPGVIGESPGGRIVPRRVAGNFRLVCDFVNAGEGETPLIRDARFHGVRVIPGVEIFRKQAEIQSSHFLSLIA